MGKKITPKAAASNISSKANPATSSITQTSNKSSILRSSFAPSALQLSLFASVIQGLDSEHLRIHDTATGRLRCKHAIGSKATITCLAWGFRGENTKDRYQQPSKKKRKRSDLTNGNETYGEGNDAVVAVGTSDSEIHLFSPSQAKIVATLTGTHQQGIRDFKFANYGLQAEGWSIGGDGRLVQWDLKKSSVIRNFVLPRSAHTLQPLAAAVLLASQDAYMFNPDSKETPTFFHASNNYVHSLLTSSNSPAQDLKFLTAAENDRFVSVFDETSTNQIGSLRTGSAALSLDLFSDPDGQVQNGDFETLSARMSKPKDVLAAVTEEGILEIFPEPFDFDSEGSLKERMKQRTRPAASRVRITRPDKGSTIVPLVNASFQGNAITMVWAEGGASLVFEKMQWRSESTGNLLLDTTHDIVKAKEGSVAADTILNGVKDMGKAHVDESHAIVSNGGISGDVPMDDAPLEVIEISSAEEESDSEDDAPADPSGKAKANMKGNPRGEPDDDVDMEDAEMQAIPRRASRGESQDPREKEELSFGDLMRANAVEAVDVQAAFMNPASQALVPTEDRSLQQLPSGMSLGTVLTQSLRTNDTNLLETCFHVKDLSTVRATIERLESQFATILLQRLAERLHSRPGRAGSLMVWIQWTIVAHGGYLARQPELMKKLASLHRVVQERAKSLQSLLSLKGKLDMLEAQMNLRKSMQAHSAAANALEEDDEEGVIYVEGQEESGSEQEDHEDRGFSPELPTKAGAKAERIPNDEEDASGDRDAESEADDDGEDDEDDGEPMPTTNGVASSSEGEGSDSDEEALFDEEASSTDNDSVDEGSNDDIDHESVDSADSSDADTSPPPKKPAKSVSNNNNLSKSSKKPAQTISNGGDGKRRR